MKKLKNGLIVLLISFIGMISCNNDVTDNLNIWTGSKIIFTKADGADWTLEENQDRITSNVWITRANTKGIFNIVSETGYGAFNTWINTSGNNPTSLLNKDLVLHLITDDIYIDIKFISFSGGGSAGGFAYERSTK